MFSCPHSSKHLPLKNSKGRWLAEKKDTHAGFEQDDRIARTLLLLLCVCELIPQANMIILACLITRKKKKHVFQYSITNLNV